MYNPKTQPISCAHDVSIAKKRRLKEFQGFKTIQNEYSYKYKWSDAEILGINSC